MLNYTGDEYCNRSSGYSKDRGPVREWRAGLGRECVQKAGHQWGGQPAGSPYGQLPICQLLDTNYVGDGIKT